MGVDTLMVGPMPLRLQWLLSRARTELMPA